MPTSERANHKPIVFIAIAGFMVLLFLGGFIISPAVANAGRTLPPNDLTRQVVYDGLEISNNLECKGGYLVQVPGSPGKKFCTPGPDPLTDAVLSHDARKKSSASPRSNSVSAPGTVCAGDGVTGNRVQVLYAHAADVPSRYVANLESFQQWAADIDSVFNASAQVTGGYRRVRFVTDADCKPLVTEVMLSATGDDSFGLMIGELLAQGYNRSDRKYIVFTDARKYCGIANIEFDDQPSQLNANNFGPHFARIDAGCWSGTIAAHELMHTLGGVQLTAPNSDGNFHCNDGYDNMCNYSGHTVSIVCADTSNALLFDCGHEDYFSVNPTTGSYLGTFWNAANSQFLINSPPVIPQPSNSNPRVLIPLITLGK